MWPKAYVLRELILSSQHYKEVMEYLRNVAYWPVLGH